MELPFIEILLALSEENVGNGNINDLIINTIRNDDFVFKCYDAVEVSELINYILQEMKKRSVYVVAVQVCVCVYNFQKLKDVK